MITKSQYIYKQFTINIRNVRKVIVGTKFLIN